MMMLGNPRLPNSWQMQVLVHAVPLNLIHTTNSPAEHHVLAILLMKFFITAIFSTLNEMCEILGSLFFPHYTTTTTTTK
jgi:hypothetical protein